ncbi:MAG: glycosyltransferase [Candidatus Moranbacteria bacterium]|nr:glycosyltransferase [Candidatus Moranbacteria bacterium]
MQKDRRIDHENLPLVTVVTVTFNLIRNNRKETFLQSVESVHLQTYQNIEHIVIDGASNDGTADLLASCVRKYKRLRYISEPDRGIYDAMNKGIMHARGKYVVFLNSDDYWHDLHGVEWSVEALERSGAAFSYAPAKILDQKKSCQWVVYPDLSSVFFSASPFNHQTMFTRRDVLLREGMFDDSLLIMGDLDLILRLVIRKYDSVFVDRIFTTYRLSGMSTELIYEGDEEAAKVLYKYYNTISVTDIDTCRRIRATKRLPLGILSHVHGCSIVQAYFLYEFLPAVRKNFSRISLNIGFVIFSPKKFLKKYYTKILHSWLRQPVRKVYYALRREKKI